jgi:hypothetical protein
MTSLRIAFVVLVSVLPALGQGFINLDFEQSTVLTTIYPSSCGDFAYGTANLSGWNASGWGVQNNYAGGTMINYNRPPLDSPGLSLVTPAFTDGPSPALDGQYSVFLLGGDVPGFLYPASIGQTAQIPLTAKSIDFLAAGFIMPHITLEVTFNGNLLSLIALQGNPSYWLFGADISAYAGTTGHLLFTQPLLSGSTVIDDITFSTSQIPEPSVATLLELGIVLLYSFKMTWFCPEVCPRPPVRLKSGLSSQARCSPAGTRGATVQCPV